MKHTTANPNPLRLHCFQAIFGPNYCESVTAQRSRRNKMGDGFRGVSAERDGRFKLAEKKLMAKMKFPPEYVHKVDMSKVHLEVLKPWVAKKVSTILSSVDRAMFILMLELFHL